MSTIASTERKTYDAAEVAALLGCGVSTVYRMAKDAGGINGVPAIWISSRRVVFAKALIDRMLGIEAEDQDAVA
jgi:predicted DNA-binding transcriptional regulator AlpA